MTLDLNLLSPAPWHKCQSQDGKCPCKLIWSRKADVVIASTISNKCKDFEEGVTEEHAQANADFIALARNDLDVRLRRGWHTEKCTEVNQWFVPQLYDLSLRQMGGPSFDFAIFTAACYQDGHDVGLLTKAEAWFKEHIEEKT